MVLALDHPLERLGSIGKRKPKGSSNSATGKHRGNEDARPFYGKPVLRLAVGLKYVCSWLKSGLRLGTQCALATKWEINVYQRTTG
jgi:hypothetical protein